MSGILKGVVIGGFEDFLSRDEAGRPGQRIVDIETEADLLACELLVPSATVAQTAAGDATKAVETARSLGLPDDMADEWANYAISLYAKTDRLIQSIEQALKKKR